MQDVRSLRESLSLFLKQIPEKSIYRCRFNTLEDLVPVEIDIGGNQLSGEIDEIIRRYEKRGFALFELKFNDAGSEAVNALAKILNLGEPYIPARYKNRNIISLYQGGINIISTHVHGKAINQIEGARQQDAHAFTNANEQKLHVDGTLEEIGLIKTSILLCTNPAISGGENIIFNSVAAFIELAEQDINAAVSLLDPRCLKRIAPGYGGSCTGSVFLIKNENIFTRYSTDTTTSSWSDGLSNVSHLERAYEYLNDMAKPGFPFCVEIKLKLGQGLIIANNQISHGRRSYVESQNNIRTMLRGLFKIYPSASSYR